MPWDELIERMSTEMAGLFHPDREIVLPLLWPTPSCQPLMVFCPQHNTGFGQYQGTMFINEHTGEITNPVDGTSVKRWQQYLLRKSSLYRTANTMSRGTIDGCKTQ